MKSLLEKHIQDYINLVSDKPLVIQKKLAEETEKIEFYRMMTPHDQAALLSMLVNLMGVKTVIEIGVFTGYSTLAIALSLPEDGKIVACDNNVEWTNIAQKYWSAAGVRDKIELRLGLAKDTLEELIATGDIQFDLAYVDADKNNYDYYYEACLSLVRPNGLICLDNMLWSGRVAVEDPEADQMEQSDKYTNSLRELASKISEDERVSSCLLPIGDGLHLVRKL